MLKESALAVSTRMGGGSMMNPTKKNSMFFLKIFLIVVCVLPIYITCFYAMPVDDDFTNANTIREMISENGSYFLSALKRSKDLYFSTSGYYFSAFLNTFFTPFLRWGVRGLRVFCLGNNLIFHITLFFFVRTLSKKTIKNIMDDAILTIYVMLLFCFTNISLNLEIAFWYCGNVGYLLPLSVILWGSVYFLNAIENEKKYWLFGAMVLGFLGSGGALNVTALNCFIFLMIAGWGIFVEKRIKVSVMCFGSALAGALINVASPGNYLRHDLVSNEYDVIGALINSVKFTINRTGHLLSDSLLPFILIGLFIYLLFSSPIVKDIHRLINPVWMIMLFLGAQIVVAFPVYLGYGNYMPERCVFIQDSLLFFSLFIMVIYIYIWLQQRHLEHIFDRRLAITVLVSLIVPFCMWHAGKSSADSCLSIYLSKQIINGEDKKYVIYWDSILDEIEASGGRIVIVRPSFDSPKLLKDIDLKSDPTHWVNAGIASYYNKDSVELVIDDTIEN